MSNYPDDIGQYNDHPDSPFYDGPTMCDWKQDREDHALSVMKSPADMWECAGECSDDDLRHLVQVAGLVGYAASTKSEALEELLITFREVVMRVALAGYREGE